MTRGPWWIVAVVAGLLFAAIPPALALQCGRQAPDWKDVARMYDGRPYCIDLKPGDSRQRDCQPGVPKPEPCYWSADHPDAEASPLPVIIRGGRREK